MQMPTWFPQRKNETKWPGVRKTRGCSHAGDHFISIKANFQYADAHFETRYIH